MPEMQKTLRQLRVDAQLNQEELAQRLNITRFMVSSYENGREPPLECLTAYAKFFNVSCDWLLGLTAERQPNATNMSDALDALAPMMSASGIQPLAASEFSAFVGKLTQYYLAGAPAGSTPVDCLRTYMAAMGNVLDAAISGSTADLLDKTNAAAVSGMQISDVLKRFLELEKTEK